MASRAIKGTPAVPRRRERQLCRESRRRPSPVAGDSGADNTREGAHLGDARCFVPDSGGVRVFLVMMQRHFVAADASVPPGAAAPVGRYLSLVVDARTFEVLDFGLSPKPPPVSPASLGPVRYLSGRH